MARSTPRSFVPLLTALAVLPVPAGAHAIRLSQGIWSMDQAQVHAVLTFHQAEFRALAPPGLEGLAAETSALARVAQGIEVETSGQRCPLESSLLRPIEADGTSIELGWRCRSGAHRWTVRLPILAELSAGHTHLARASAGGPVVERVARASTPSFEVKTNPSVLDAAWRFLRLGVEHIFAGYDHLAFLLALLLLGGRFTDLVKVITSFSVAHSVTLALAALNLVVLPPSLVEPAIAASIVVVAVENLWALRSGVGREDRLGQVRAHRWRITLLFGLVHGFGFADALRALELPRAALAAGLVSFNLGVELGQLAVVAVSIPMLHALASLRGFEPRGVRMMSLAIGALGLLWLSQRLGGVA